MNWKSVIETVREYLTLPFHHSSPSHTHTHTYSVSIVISVITSVLILPKGPPAWTRTLLNWRSLSNAERIPWPPFHHSSPSHHHFPSTSFLLSVSYSVLDFSWLPQGSLCVGSTKKEKETQRIKEDTPQQIYHKLFVIVHIQSYNKSSLLSVGGKIRG